MNRGFVIAATQSGSGKTTVTLGLLRALVRRGYTVAPFKVGPDFIDPGHHARVTGAESRNLDGWMVDRSVNLAAFHGSARDADVAIVEGVMGLFDGYDGRTEAGSTAEMAKWLGLPVVLAVDARSMARSAAALVQGFERFDPGLRFAGVIFNRLGSPRHLDYLQEALEGNVAMPCLGGIPRDEAIAMPERHLGLVTREDHPLSDENLDRLADLMEARLDLDRLLASAAVEPIPAAAETQPPYPAPRVRVGVARDAAFCFYYPDNLEILRRHGAEIVPFSPVQGDPLPDDLDGLYFGGGYPELYAGRLSGNGILRRQVLEACRAGMPIYGECGGFMYLCRELTDTEGTVHPMVGCFPFATRMLPRLKALGYREVTLTRGTILGGPGAVIRGHEFHYSEMRSEIEPEDGDGAGPGEAPPSVYRITDRRGVDRAPEGFVRNRTLGSYIHLHFASRPEAGRCFVDACATHRKERKGNP